MEQNNNNTWAKIIYLIVAFFDLTKWLILVLVILSIINSFFFGLFVVSGESMSPNFENQDLVFWQKSTYKNSNPARGDVVVVEYPGDPTKQTYVKRIIGLPNDKVELKNGRVYINDKLYSEPYLDPGVLSDPDGVWNIKNGDYFVMGDNRSNSNDSRYFGAVDKRFILGKAIGVIYPDFRLVQDF